MIAVYIGAVSVTVIGAGWSPDTAQLLAREIMKVTNKPVSDVILPITTQNTREAAPTGSALARMSFRRS